MLPIIKFIVVLAGLIGDNTSDSYQVGGTEIHVPAPASTTKMTDKLGLVYRFQKNGVSSDNRQLAAWLPTEKVEPAMRGDKDVLKRYYSAQIADAAEVVTWSSEDFIGFREVVRTTLEESTRKVAAEVEGDLDDINASYREIDEQAANVSSFRTTTLEPHLDTENAIAWSSLIAMRLESQPSTNETQLRGEYKGVVTAAFLLVRGKLLTLYVHAEAKDLDWSRQACANWVNSTLAANEIVNRQMKSDELGKVEKQTHMPPEKTGKMASEPGDDMHVYTTVSTNALSDPDDLEDRNFRGDWTRTLTLFFTTLAASIGGLFGFRRASQG